jgi:putative Ca2+/H+ antiporter (TMEM165/GDT1 family)
VQTVVAVLLGHVASFLPAGLVQGVAAAMFLVGAVLLFREGRAHHQSSGEEYVANARDVHGVRQVLACFLILFAAEWGDLSQLFTITLVAKYEDPIGVFIGALGALMTVSALAVVAGKQLLRWIPLHVLHYLGAGVCLTLALVTGYELVA